MAIAASGVGADEGFGSTTERRRRPIVEAGSATAQAVVKVQIGKRLRPRRLPLCSLVPVALRLGARGKLLRFRRSVALFVERYTACDASLPPGASTPVSLGEIGSAAGHLDPIQPKASRLSAVRVASLGPANDRKRSGTLGLLSRRLHLRRRIDGVSASAANESRSLNDDRGAPLERTHARVCGEWSGKATAFFPPGSRVATQVSYRT